MNITHTRHELKSDPAPFADLLSGEKTNEIRKDDRDFKVGDTLIFRETKYSAVNMFEEPGACPLIYTGRTQWRFVSHVQRGYGLQEGHVALSFLLADAVTAVPSSDAATVAVLTAERDAYKWAYGYLQDRMESLHRPGWAHDCDGEIEYRINQARGGA
jgi:hypothetical protein